MEFRVNLLVVFDRDDTLVEDPGFFGKDSNWREQLKVNPFAAEVIKELNSHDNVYVVVATNQAGVALGYFDEKRVVEINKAIDDELVAAGARIDGWYYCPEVDPEYARKKGIDPSSKYVKETMMRKPHVGMILEAARDLNLKDFYTCCIGDKYSDVKLADNMSGLGILYIPENRKMTMKNVSDVLRCRSLDCFAIVPNLRVVLDVLRREGLFPKTIEDKNREAMPFMKHNRTDNSIDSGRCIKGTTETDTIKARVTTLGARYKGEQRTD